jgi:hypothetical protein
VTFAVTFVFLDEEQWQSVIDDYIFHKEPNWLTRWKLNHLASGFEEKGTVYIRKKVRGKKWFKKMALRELGHAILNLDDSKLGIMAAYRWLRF